MPRFRDALSGPGLAAIAEFKRRSPSAGDLRPGADPARLAAEFEREGAAAVSILVDERFAGSVADLRAARASTELPLLAKGFFSEERKLVELEDAGADAVLLLLRDVEDHRAAALMAQKRFDAKLIHTHTFGLAEVPTAIKYARERIEDAIKVVVKMSGS